MFAVIGNSWALLLGMFLLMLGNGMQGTVLGLRGGIEAYESTTMGFVMAGYFAGFLGGAQVTPWLLRRVGHVRVFAALGSLISAAFIIFAAFVDPIAWTLMRVIVGVCYSGVYVVAESWLNDSSTNETRGRTLSAYLIVQMLGIVAAQSLINVADPGGYDLFIIMSVAVSISFAPMLLSASPAPVFSTTRRMPLKTLFKTSPLGCVGTFFLGAIFAAQFGMGPVFATEIGMKPAQISIFIGAIYLGGLLLQYPIGWASDRIDRRVLIAWVTAIGTLGAVLAFIFSGSFPMLIAAAFIIGGMSNPLYSLLIAHTNDFLEHEDMASASGGLIVLNGVGAAGTPILVGYLMEAFGPNAFLFFIGWMMALVAAYATYRMTVRPAPAVEDTSPVAPYSMVSGTQYSAEYIQEMVLDETEDSVAEEN